MNNKNNFRYIITIIAVIVVFSLILFLKDVFFSDEKQDVELYFIDKTMNLKCIDDGVLISSNENMVIEILDRLRVSTGREDLKATLPSDLEIKDVVIENNVASINFSSEYNNLVNIEEIFARTSVVWSVTSLDFVENVILNVDGKPLKSTTGTSFGKMNRDNTIINGEISAKPTGEYQIVSLYFGDSVSNDLIVEKRVIDVEINKSRERAILENLILGSDESNINVIPKETKINDVTTTDDGICYVNLNQDFINKHTGGFINEVLTIYSIVNSLCEIGNISKVQFLIDGERLDTFKGEIDISKPIEATDIMNIINDEQEITN